MHTIHAWLASGDWKPNFDGAATLVAALVAILAAIVAYRAATSQIKANRENLQKQSDAEKEAREENSRQRRVAMARVMLADLRGVYFALRSLDILRSTDPESIKPLPLFKAIPSEWSTVFAANSSTLGDLDAHVVSAVVAFYSTGPHFLACLREYEASAEKVHKGDDIFEQDIISRRLLVSLKSTFEGLRLSMYLASGSLCKPAGAPFCPRDVPIAAEEDLLERLRKTQPKLAEGIQKSGEDAQTY